MSRGGTYDGSDGSAATTFTVDLVGLGYDRPEIPPTVDVELSRTANNGMHVRVDGSDRWGVDIRRSRTGPVAAERVYKNGARFESDLPAWVEAVIDRVDGQLREGSA